MRSFFIASVVVCFFCLVESATACSVCFGPPEEPMMQGVKFAIYALLGVTGFVLSCFLVFIGVLWKRSSTMCGDDA